MGNKRYTQRDLRLHLEKLNQLIAHLNVKLRHIPMVAYKYHKVVYHTNNQSAYNDVATENTPYLCSLQATIYVDNLLKENK